MNRRVFGVDARAKSAISQLLDGSASLVCPIEMEPYHPEKSVVPDVILLRIHHVSIS